jgi:hypothetical protein
MINGRKKHKPVLRNPSFEVYGYEGPEVVPARLSGKRGLERR